MKKETNLMLRMPKHVRELTISSATEIVEGEEPEKLPDEIVEE